MKLNTLFPLTMRSLVGAKRAHYEFIHQGRGSEKPSEARQMSWVLASLALKLNCARFACTKDRIVGGNIVLHIFYIYKNLHFSSKLNQISCIGFSWHGDYEYGVHFYVWYQKVQAKRAKFRAGSCMNVRCLLIRYQMINEMCTHHWKSGIFSHDKFLKWCHSL